MQRRRAATPRRPLVVLAACSVVVVLAAGPSAAAPAAGSAVVPAPPSVPVSVLPATEVADGSTSPSAPARDAALVVRLLAALRAEPLGTDVTVSVVDAGSGAVLVSRGDARPQQPASTLKTLTAITVLHALGPDAHLTTKVVTGRRPTEIVLIGAGDSTLTRLPSTAADVPTGQSARPASLTELATATAAALRQSGTARVTVGVDDTLFTGPRLAPGWPATYVSTGIASPASALSADGGRVSADSRVRDLDPALAAGRFFIGALRSSGIVVDGDVTRVTAPVSPSPSPSAQAVATETPTPTPTASVAGTELASVRSPTMAELVERTLTASDNDLAEALAHLAGRATGHPASFEGGAAAVTETMAALGVPTSGLRVVDGSGLSRLNLASAATLTDALVSAAIDQPEVGDRAGALWPVTSGLPIAGVTGTLIERFDTPGTSDGRGVVRAKTGTLSGVVSLAGVVRDRQGRVLVFTFVADRSPGPLLDAQAALDRAASVLASA